MEYARHYERFSIGGPNALQRFFIRLLARRARTLGQASHKMWTLKYLIDRYLPGCPDLSVLDCGTWNGWFLSYETVAITRKVAIDRDPHFAQELRAEGVDFITADIDAGRMPVADESMDLVAMLSVLEHLESPEAAVADIARVLKPGGIVAVIVPDIMRYRFRFWDDATHRHPFNASSLRMLFETHGIETLDLHNFNHDLFVAGHLFPGLLHRFLMRFRGRLLLYVGAKGRRNPLC